MAKEVLNLTTEVEDRPVVVFNGNEYPLRDWNEISYRQLTKFQQNEGRLKAVAEKGIKTEEEAEQLIQAYDMALDFMFVDFPEEMKEKISISHLLEITEFFNKRLLSKVKTKDAKKKKKPGSN